MFAALIGAVTAAATLAMQSPAMADGPITLWYQRGCNPEQQRILQKDLVAPFNAAHPSTPLTLDVRGGSNGDRLGQGTGYRDDARAEHDVGPCAIGPFAAAR
jgi:raffinose/stachyose/melibiose transport system substrate-binding protein